MSGSGSITENVSIYGKVPIEINLIREGLPSVFDKTRRVGHWKVHYFIGFEMLVGIEQGMRA
jgi:hypothetical protein